FSRSEISSTTSRTLRLPIASTISSRETAICSLQKNLYRESLNSQKHSARGLLLVADRDHGAHELEGRRLQGAGKLLQRGFHHAQQHRQCLVPRRQARHLVEIVRGEDAPSDRKTRGHELVVG